jgi:SOS-response transcriptional repressor LexA
MVGMGIHDGVAVMIDRTEPVRPGRIILARLYGYEYTLKRYEPPYLIGDSYERIEIPIEPEMNLHIVGVAKGAYIPFYK